jgi:hypothetical protein
MGKQGLVTEEMSHALLTNMKQEFRISRKKYFSFYLKSEEPQQKSKTSRVPYLGLDFVKIFEICLVT